MTSICSVGGQAFALLDAGDPNTDRSDPGSLLNRDSLVPLTSPGSWTKEMSKADGEKNSAGLFVFVPGETRGTRALNSRAWPRTTGIGRRESDGSVAGRGRK